jgi:transposase
MRQIREVLRHKWELGLTHRETSRALDVSIGAVSEVLARAGRAGLVDFESVREVSESALEARLYPRVSPAASEVRALPDCPWIHRERRRPGVTLELLHQEYLDTHPTGYRYTQFCEHYRKWCDRYRLSMRQVHVSGEKSFVDYAGKRPQVVNPVTGERVFVELFIGVLGASNLTFVEATATQRVEDWCASHVRMFEYFGGVTRALVCDQLKSGVVHACAYEPVVQRTYDELAAHYGTTILPARPMKPKDKAKAENAVLIAERWILARLRNEEFSSLAALNVRIAELLERLNAKVMKLYGASRRDLFERIERSELRALPTERFTFGIWRQARVNIDYHVEVDHHYYSVPYTLVRESVETRMTSAIVEVLHRGERVALHQRSRVRGQHTTVPEHMPASHRAHKEWSPSRLVEWAAGIGPETKAYVERLLTARPHPEQGYRSCLGLMRLAKQHGGDRVENACRRGNAAKACSYRNIQTILDNGLDRVAAEENALPSPPFHHSNIRGPAYYQ